MTLLAVTRSEMDLEGNKAHADRRLNVRVIGLVKCDKCSEIFTTRGQFK